MSDIFVVASKVKKLIKEKGDCNTSASTMEALSQRLAQIVDKAIQNAKAEGRKTVMDRDVPPVAV